MSKLIIIRGLPGSGKSTIAKNYMKAFGNLLAERGHPTEHVEADMFFEDANGNYNYDNSKIADAHKWCQEQVKKFLINGIDVIVTNTFTRKWEVDPYIKMVEPQNLMILVATGDFGNVHGVPPEVIQKMKDRWEDMPGEFIVTNGE